MCLDFWAFHLFFAIRWFKNEINSFFGFNLWSQVHRLLSQGTYGLRMDMEDIDDQTRYVKYRSLDGGKEPTKFIAIVPRYSGDVVKILFIFIQKHFKAFWIWLNVSFLLMVRKLILMAIFYG